MPEPDMSVWTGRVDTADGPRRAAVAPDGASRSPPDAPPGIVLIGFACDEGVRRNGGRVGAKDGPRAIRAALANLAWHQDQPGLRRRRCAVRRRRPGRRADRGSRKWWRMRSRAGHRPLVLGGGHETAWGTFQGIVAAKPEANVGVINIDAHLDLRADEPGNSGTPFNQIADWCRDNGRPFVPLPRRGRAVEHRGPVRPGERMRG